MSRNKWFKFDAETWLSDPKLRSISYGAQGLWINIICLCHISEKYGYLTVNGQQMDRKQLQNCMNPAKNWNKCFDELVENNILKQDENGFYYCHKLLKDKKFSEKQAIFGAMRGAKKPEGNPQGYPQPEEEKEEEKEKELEEDKKNNKKINQKEKLKSLLDHPYFLNKDFFDSWEDFCEHRGKNFTTLSKIQCLEKLFEVSVDRSIESIKNSISSNWRGVFPESIRIKSQSESNFDKKLKIVEELRNVVME